MSGTKTTADYDYNNILQKMNDKLILLEHNTDIWDKNYKQIVDVIQFKGEWVY